MQKGLVGRVYGHLGYLVTGLVIGHEAYDRASGAEPRGKERPCVDLSC